MQRLWNYTKRIFGNQRGEWDWGGAGGGAATGFGTGMMIGGPIGAGIGTMAGGLWGGLFGGGDDEMSQYDMWEREFEERKKPATFLRAPEHPEAVGARGKWWEELQGGYLPEDWGDIWEQTKKKYSQYYWGGPGGEPGIAAKVKAGAARRGVSESPALETMMGRMGMAEAGGLRDIDVEEIKGRMGERQNWLGQISSLAGMQVPGTWDKYGGMAVAQPTPTTPWGDLASAAGGYLGMMGQGQPDYDKYGFYKGGMGVSSPGEPYDEWSNIFGRRAQKTIM